MLLPLLAALSFSAGRPPPLGMPRTGCIAALAIGDVAIGDVVRVVGDATYPRFMNVPGIKDKDGFAACGSVGKVVKLYQPGECDHLDRSDERDVCVEFMIDGEKPKAWKAHLAPYELEFLSDTSESGSERSFERAIASDIELCSVEEGSDCDTVEDYMTRLSDALVLSPEMGMSAAAKLLYDFKVTGAPVADSDGKLVGVLTQFDFLFLEGVRDERGLGSMVSLDSGQWENIVKKSMASTVGAAMSTPIAVTPRSNIRQVAQLMLQRRFNHLPVIRGDNGALVGILTSQNVLKHVMLRLAK